MEVAPYAWLKQNLNDKGEEISFYVINVADPTRSLNKRRQCKVNKRSAGFENVNTWEIV